MIMLASPSFIQPITVVSGDIDHMGHVNNASYVRWAQFMAEAYWSSIAPPTLFATRLWIAIEHHVRYLRPGFLQDRLAGHLRFMAYRGARAMFHLNIVREQEVLASIESSWCCIDAVTHRPAKLPSDLVRVHLFEATSG